MKIERITWNITRESQFEEMLDYEICNATYRLDKIERLLFQLDYEVMDVTTQDLYKFLLMTNIKSHKRIFSPFALLVTSSSPL